MSSSEEIEDHVSWRFTWRWINKLGGTFVSHFYKRGLGATVDSELLTKVDKLRGNTPRSRIIETLLQLYVKNPDILKEML